MKVQNTFLNTPKRKWIAVVSALIIIVLVFATVGTILGIKGWEDRSNQARAQYDQLVAKKTEIKNAETKNARLQGIRDITTVKTDVSCEGTMWSNWQVEVFTSVRQAKEECQAAHSMSTKLAQAAEALKTYLDEEQKILTVVRNLKIDATKPEWQAAAHKSAQSSLKQLDEIKLSTAGAKILSGDLKSRLQQIDQKWIAIEQASEKKDKTAYQRALGELKDAYKTLPEISALSSKQLQPLVNSFIK